MARRRKRGTAKIVGGRYTVEERSAPSLGAAVAYAASLAMNERRDVVVNLIGGQRPLYRCTYDPNDRSVSVIHQGGPRV